jgi:hypothetical protein
MMRKMIAAGIAAMVNFTKKNTIVVNFVDPGHPSRAPPGRSQLI